PGRKAEPYRDADRGQHDESGERGQSEPVWGDDRLSTQRLPRHQRGESGVAGGGDPDQGESTMFWREPGYPGAEMSEERGEQRDRLQRVEPHEVREIGRAHV